MAITVGELAILLTAKNEMSKVLQAVQSDMAQAQASGLGLGKVLGTALAGGAALAVGATVAVGKALYDAGQAAAAEEVGIAKLGAAVKATGADWDTASAAIETYLTKELARTALDDGEGREAISRLTTITGDYTKALDLMGLAQDLAAAKGIDLSSAAEIVGRVSAGNTGILSRYGIVLGEGATATEALAQMQKQFSGQAEAYGNTYAGAQQKMDVALGNLKETVGTLVLPAMTSLANLMADFASRAIPWVEQAVERLRPLFSTAFEVVQTTVIPIIEKAVAWIGSDLPKAMGQAKDSTNILVVWVRENFPLIQQTIKTVMDAIETLWKAVWPVLSTVLETTWTVMKTVVETYIGNVLSIIRAVMLIINGDWSGAWGEVKKIFGDTWEAIQGILSTTIDAMLGLFSGAIGRFEEMGRNIIQGLINGLDGARQWLMDKVNSIVGSLPDWAKKVLGIGSPSRVFAEIGVDTMLGLAEGLKQASGLPLGELKNLVSDMASIFGDIGKTIGSAGDIAVALPGIKKAFDNLYAELDPTEKFIQTKIIPLLRQLHKVFKYQLPELMGEDLTHSFEMWSTRMGAIASILDSAVKASQLVFEAAKGFAKWAGWSLETIRDAITEQILPVIRGIHAAFKNLPILSETEVIAESLSIWADRYGSIAGILDGAVKASALVFDAAKGFTKWAGWSLETIRDAIVEQIMPVIRGIHAAFKTLPLLSETETIAESLAIWADRYGSITGILDAAVNASAAVFDAASGFGKWAGWTIENIRDAIIEQIMPVIRGIHAAMKTLPTLVPEETISASMAIWASRMGSALSIIQSTVNIAALDLKDYRAPDLVVIRRLAQDAQSVVTEVSGVASSMYTTAEDMAPKVAMLDTVAGMVTKVKTILTDTIDVAKGLAEMSWREVKQNQVDSFTRNLANIVNWLTDPESGITAIANLSGLTAYESAVNALGRIITEVVEAVREIMTLPAVWDNRLLTISTGLADFFTDISTAVTAKGAGFVATWAGLATNALQAFANGFNDVPVRDIWTNIVAGAAATLNDGVFRQLGFRNATAYKNGWEAGMQIASPSKVAEGWGRAIQQGLQNGMNQTTNNSYTLNVTTSQPAVNVVSSFRMLEAMA